MRKLITATLRKVDRDISMHENLYYDEWADSYSGCCIYHRCDKCIQTDRIAIAITASSDAR